MPSVAWITGDFANTTPPSPNGCAWYRMVLPSRQVRALGWETGVGMPLVYGEGIGIAHDDGVVAGWDVTVTKLLMHRKVPDLFRVMQGRGERVIVDVDDFHYGLHPENIAAKATDPHRNADVNRAFYEQAIRRADTVTVSTGFLADFYSARCRDVRLVRNALDTERFPSVEQPLQPTFGWVGGTLWRSGDLEMLADWLPRFVDDYEVRVHHSGHIPGDPKHLAVRAGLRQVSTRTMCLIGEYPSMFENIHVGLVPLAGNDFNRAKSYLKGLEYAASGIPFIASPTEEYRILYEAGVGRLASSPDEWRDHATELLDPDVRRTEGERIRGIVQRDFDISGMGEAWVTAISG